MGGSLLLFIRKVQIIHQNFLLKISRSIKSMWKILLVTCLINKHILYIGKVKVKKQTLSNPTLTFIIKRNISMFLVYNKNLVE